MKDLREKYLDGLVDDETYREAAVTATIDLLESEHGYRYVKGIGEGSFGSVVEVYSPVTDTKLAAKIVLTDDVSEGEVKIWPKLMHENVLPLVWSHHFVRSHARVFYMPVYPTALDDKINAPSFRQDETALQQAIAWTKGIAKGLSYLHDRGFSHLDLKLNNVLLSSKNVATLCDFGFLRKARKRVNEYGGLFIFRPPEARIINDKQTKVDGKKFDVWTLGTLVSELFTREALLTDEMELEVSCWFQQVYPILQHNLQSDTFLELITVSFPCAPDVSNKADDVLNFVLYCLHLNPKKRPTLKDVLEHRLLGHGSGCYRPYHRADIWTKRVSLGEMRIILKANKLKPLDGSQAVESPSIQKDRCHSAGHSSEPASSATLPSMSSRDYVDDDFEEDAENAAYLEHGKKGEINVSRRQKIRQWLQRKKCQIFRLFTACVPVRRQR